MRTCAFSTLTGDLAAAAWSIFQDIEQKGGIVSALQSGDIGSRLAASQKARADMIGKRRLGITGVTEFPNLDDPSLDVLDRPIPADWAPPVAAPRADQLTSCTPLEQTRDAEPYEQMRDIAEAGANERSTIFLATMGKLPDFTVRAVWTRNLFAVAGLATTEPESFANAADVAAAFKSSGLKLACICSSDSIYADLAVDTASVLKQAGAEHLYLAGDLPGLRDALKEAGVDDTLKAGLDIRPVLKQMQSLLGIKGGE